MKILISQDGRQVFTIGANNLINISAVEIEKPAKVTLYSIGIEGISFGLFKREASALEIFKEFMEFLCCDRPCFKMPDDRDD